MWSAFSIYLVLSFLDTRVSMLLEVVNSCNSWHSKLSEDFCRLSRYCHVLWQLLCWSKEEWSKACHLVPSTCIAKNQQLLLNGPICYGFGDKIQQFSLYSIVLSSNMRTCFQPVCNRNKIVKAECCYVFSKGGTCLLVFAAGLDVCSYEMRQWSKNKK